MSNQLIKNANINDNLIKKITEYKKNTTYVLENVNKNIIDEVLKRYKKINYITITTMLIDEVITNLNRINDNYLHHRYNKSYYEREINNIKKQIKDLRMLKNNPIVNNEIIKLRRELFTKSKDKYDILYNNEIFMNIDKQCDDLINKVNTKVIDIKKNINEEKISKRDEYLKNILLRFQDLSKSYEIIENHLMEIKLTNFKEIIDYINNLYSEYLIGIKNQYNFSRNKDKTELVILFNGLNKVIDEINKIDFMPMMHINFKMNDLIDAVIVKMNELTLIITEKYNYEIDNSEVNKKINYIISKDKK